VIPVLVTVDKVAVDQAFDDTVIGRHHPGIADLFVAKTSHQQNRGIEAVAAKLARVAVEFGVEPLSLDDLADRFQFALERSAAAPEADNAFAIERQQALERPPA